MGPDNSFLYFGPETSIGFIMYGNNRTQIGMNFLLRPGKKEGSMYLSLFLLSRILLNKLTHVENQLPLFHNAEREGA